MVGKAVGRTTLVGQILENLLFWRTQIFSTKFLERWEKRLAYLGEWVAVIRDGGAGRKDSFKGQVLGLEPDGSLRIQMPDGSIKTLNKGAYRISPVKNKLEEIIRER